ncbi:gas vesicle protein GvpJ [Actinocatenispora sera]|uniref:Gas vesicle protein GvpA/GvpJ/GvpM family n=1 Tax=Actinocatenispora sera TaxID=390989 RepID=A0A810L8R9_9ACTN|nr:gas vesicle protein GvpJ [Actinocatenispora sera]BCJ31693.1 hypothetical protein Asera_58010 [Actinocatenispora sera]
MAERRLMLDDGSLVDLLDRLVDTGVVVDGNVIIALSGVDLIRLDLRALVAALATLADGAEPPPDSGLPRTATPTRRAPRDTPQDEAEAATTNRSRARRRPEPSHTNRWSDGTAAAPPAPPAVPAPPGVPAQSATPAVPTPPATSALSARTAGGRAGSDPGDIVGRLGRQLGQAQNQSGLAGLVVVVVDLVRQLLQRQALRRMDAGNLTDDEVERLGRALMSLEQQVADLVEVLDLRPRGADGRR